VLSRLVVPPHPVDLGLTLGVLQRGASDPSMRSIPDGLWRASRTPHGPSTARYSRDGDAFEVRAWGDGAEWTIEHAPDILGCRDDDAEFVAHHDVVRDARRRLPGLRFCRTLAVLEAIVPTILEQKITSREAHRVYARIVARFGEPAPGPLAGLRVPPSPETLATLPSWEYHRCGLERRRAAIIQRVCARSDRLDKLGDDPIDPTEARRVLQHFDGVGPWTANEVSAIALGDADAVSVGDYHLPNLISFVFTGERSGDDERMLELLEPYRGHRGRVIRLLENAGPRMERRGPRSPVRDIAAI